MSTLPKSPNIISFYGFTETPLAIIMKYYAYSLKDLQKGNALDQQIVYKIAFDVSNGMKLIHKAGILHLDLKPRTFSLHSD